METSQALADLSNKHIRIAGASGYWGDAAHATAQILAGADIDYLVYDYLAEITMSILARAKAKNPNLGYATDFITSAIAPNIEQIAKHGVKIISNAGGLNPKACAFALQVILDKLGLDLKIAVVTGDNVLTLLKHIEKSHTHSPSPEKVLSANAYLGAFPIAHALDDGANIVITGRCVDSAVTLGACIHEFGWRRDDWDSLAGGSLAGHLLECGVQSTGGNFTDWQNSPEIHNIGYPIAKVGKDGHCVLTKPKGTGGQVTCASVAEQMLYEIGDPQSYILPDVNCDFSEVRLTQTGPNLVEVRGAKGRISPPDYKVCVTYLDGFKAGNYISFVGRNSALKAKIYHESVLKRARLGLGALGLSDFTETSLEILGAGSQFGACDGTAREVVLKSAVKHDDIKGASLFLKTLAGLGLAAPPGISGFTGVRAKPTPVVRLYSTFMAKDKVKTFITTNGREKTLTENSRVQKTSTPKPHKCPAIELSGKLVSVKLYELAFARSGDKGDSANIGIYPHKPEFMPYIWAGLDEFHIQKTFAHFLTPDSAISRYYLPGLPAMNILLSSALGGGGIASLRNDPQGKAFAQILLETEITIPVQLWKAKS